MVLTNFFFIVLEMCSSILEWPCLDVFNVLKKTCFVFVGQQMIFPWSPVAKKKSD